MKTLFIDIETSPNLGYVWSLWNNNLSLKQVKEFSEILCFAYMWDSDKKAQSADVWNDGKRKMAKTFWDLLNEADSVVTFNGDHFDLKIINSLLMEEQMPPPSPYVSVDLYRIAKGVMKLPSLKLDNVCRHLGLPMKADTGGFELWVKCLEGDWDAINHMLVYCKRDVEIMPALYNRLLPWAKRGIPNAGLFVDSEDPVCPRCGGSNLQCRGTVTLTAGLYQRYQCQTKGCGHWSRSKKRIKTTTLR